jgi:hypothetical protein
MLKSKKGKFCAKLTLFGIKNGNGTLSICGNRHLVMG